MRRILDAQRAWRLLRLYWRDYRRELSTRDARSRLRVPRILLEKPDAELGVTLDILLAHYRQTHSEIRFLQVGAFDGVAGDPVFPLIEKYSLKGYLVEPQRDAFARLQRNYARFPAADFVFVNAAVGETDSTVPLYRIRADAEGPEWLHSIASLDGNFHRSIDYLIPGIERLVEVENVTCFTFPTLFQKFEIPRVDLLLIDTEGLDAEILRMFDLAARKPAIVRFEHKHLAEDTYEECLTALVGLGYRVAVGKADTLAYLGG